jgi:hypothetical protein
MNTDNVVWATAEEMTGQIPVDVTVTIGVEFDTIENLVDDVVSDYVRLVETEDGEGGISVRDLTLGREEIRRRFNAGLPDGVAGRVELQYGVDELYEYECQQQIDAILHPAA